MSPNLTHACTDAATEGAKIRRNVPGSDNGCSVPLTRPNPNRTRIHTKHKPIEPFAVGDRLPFVCGAAEVARVFRITPNYVYRLNRAGMLKAFRLPDLPGQPPRYSGVRLMAWLDGTLTVAIGFKGRG